MPPDPQGAGTRTETKVEWRNVYRTEDGGEFVSLHVYPSREWAGLVSCYSPRIAIERIETTTTITRHPIPPHAGEETKG